MIWQTNVFYIYILKCSDGKFYTGFSSDLRKRLKEHQGGNVSSTRNRKPLELLYYEAYRNKTNALKREKFLKTTKGKQQLRKQINLDP
ncbi:MAG: GIY-YIG nuclease family protein [Candidatus Levybacteria bacterium]|nr:GIY-YIG nuclease family protein [Candidatus Levybacteria bacterium]